ncbi:MAG: tetratricopeptide repeat protein [Fulvivirga sp.]
MALDRSETIEDKIDIYNALCRYYWYQSLDSSSYYCNLAQDLSITHNYTLGEAVARYKKGVIERIQGNYLKAAKHYVESLRLSKENGFDYYVAANYNALGVLYKVTEEWDEALNYFFHALEVSETNPRSKSSIYNNIGEIFLNKGQYDSALHYCQISAQLREDSPNPSNKIKTYINLGEIWFELAQLDSGRYYFDQSVDLALAIDDDLNQAKAYLGLAKIALEESNFLRSVEYSQVAKSITTKIGAQQEYLQSIELLAASYKALNQHKIALDYFQEYSDLKAVLINNAKAREINLLQLRNAEIWNESLQSKLELQEAELRAERNRNILMIAGVLILLVLAILFFVLFRVKRSVTKKLRANYAEISEQNNRLNVLNKDVDARNRAIQIQNAALTKANELKSKLISILSHDLRSPINSLSALLPLLEASSISPEEFQKILPELKSRVNVTQDFLNTLLYWAKTQIQEDSIEVEQVNVKALIDDTIDLMLPQLERKKLQIINEIDPEYCIDTDKAILMVIFKNLLSNAIKFSHEGGKIKAYNNKDQKNGICIQDYGVGISEEIRSSIFDFNFGQTRPGTQGEIGTGIGLSFVKELMHKINGDIDVESAKDEGSTFCLCFT